jgi:hypothetical protein
VNGIEAPWGAMMQDAEGAGPREIAARWAEEHGWDEDDTRVALAAEIIRCAAQAAPWMDPILHAQWDEVEGLSGPEARALVLGGWSPLLASDWPFTRALGSALERASWEV